MRFKSYSQFLKEGARWNSDKSGVLISMNDRSGDLLVTNTKKVITKTSGFGKYVFKVFCGLVTSTKEETLLKNPTVEEDYSDLMQRLKQGYFNMVSASEPDHKMSINDIHRRVHDDLTSYDEKLFFEFMKSTGKIDSKLKYVVMAESNDVMTSLMAEVISKYTGAGIVKLRKASYTDMKILRFYKELPSMDLANVSREKLTVFQKKILNDYTQFVENNLAGRNSVEAGEIGTAEEILTAMGMEVSGAPFLDNIFRLLTRNAEVSIKGNRMFNNVRNYLNTKYNFDANFISKVRECVTKDSTSKMLIIDDNIQHGSDFREIMNMCGYVVDVLQVTEKSTLKAYAQTDTVKKKLMLASTKAEKEKLEKLLKDTQLAEKSNIENITGYVLYERPVIASSILPDQREI